MEACPFCRTNIQPGATVCPGCGAELHVGPSKEMTGFMSIVCGIGSAYLSHQAGIFEHSTFFVVLAGFFFGVFLSKVLFADNRVWKRISRTTR